MDRIEITPSSLRACAASLEAASKEIAATLTVLNASLTLLSAQWTGQAHEAFDAARLRAYRNLEAQRGALAAIAKQAAEVAEGYGETDRAAAIALGGQ
ncbi:WXG100 family type VII secretion target [Leucobacter coleopterorum]|uniref:ESAT-6-like protein n=1 Tax=Leucobacter coleopterorum TaxID=2714933 RepID=A0ABX6K2D1_9MICO|nr:WXG100 family type VII secretion target [Leucobacter coleopterorum]QIM19354.1 WXG100 family type VII secretion target [Leucobacter coleopterorum]